MRTVVVVDHGRGNLRSVVNALEHLGNRVVVATSHQEIVDAGPVILPGVGAFAEAMRGLTSSGFADALREHVTRGRPLLGICLGMQLLLEASEEFGLSKGLSFLPGRVVTLAGNGARVPHVGWSRVHPSPDGWSDTPLRDLVPGSRLYFVHSFEARPSDPNHVLAVCDHDRVKITAAVKNELVVGVQFHPEKSGPAGLAILRAFCGGTNA